MILESFAGLAAALSLGASAFVTPIGAGNALTLPSQRHLVRIAPDGAPSAVWLLAIQKAGRDGDGLVFLRSDDEGQRWSYMADIQPTYSHPDRVDLLAVGSDIALVYSWEDAYLSGSTAHDVFFQWWRYRPATNDWAPAPRVLVFDSTSYSTAYLRAQLARDSRGRLWVMATRLEANGSFSLVTAVSSDGGASFQPDTTLGTTSGRAGGVLLSLGSKLIALYDAQDVGTAARYRLRDDSSPVGTWGAERVAFSEGIYHGAALSAVATPSGGMHLAYKTELEELRYRYFDGTSFGPATSLDTQGDWAVQPAITLRGQELIVFFTHVRTVNSNYELRARVLENGVLGPAQVLDGLVEFKGYPAAASSLPLSVTGVPCLFSQAIDASSSGWEKIAFLSRPPPADGGVPGPDAGPDSGIDAGPADAGPPDAGTPDAGAPDAGFVDAGSQDAGPVDAGPSDAGAADAGGLDAGSPDAGQPDSVGLPFTDSFNRFVLLGLGSGWTVVSGRWTVSQAALTRSSTESVAHPTLPLCSECQVEARVSAGSKSAGLFLRARPGAIGYRYELILRPTGVLEIRRRSGGTSVLLGQASSGVAPRSALVLNLQAVGHGPVVLTASVNGAVRLTVTDSSAAAFLASGKAGLWAGGRGISFDDFRLQAPR